MKKRGTSDEEIIRRLTLAEEESSKLDKEVDEEFKFKGNVQKKTSKLSKARFIKWVSKNKLKMEEKFNL